MMQKPMNAQKKQTLTIRVYNKDEKVCVSQTNPARKKLIPIQSFNSVPFDPLPNLHNIHHVGIFHTHLVPIPRPVLNSEYNKILASIRTKIDILYISKSLVYSYMCLKTKPS